MTTQVLNAAHPHHHTRPTLSVGLAINEREILAAQKLRYQIFAEELGARLNPRMPGVDQDIFDPYCEHLVVRDEDTGMIVGTSLGIFFIPLFYLVVMRVFDRKRARQDTDAAATGDSTHG